MLPMCFPTRFSRKQIRHKPLIFLAYPDPRLHFVILTAARNGEVLHARWPEIDLDNKLRPAHRMKTGGEHRVPMSGRALAILHDMKKFQARAG